MGVLDELNQSIADFARSIGYTANGYGVTCEWAVDHIEMSVDALCALLADPDERALIRVFSSPIPEGSREVLYGPYPCAIKYESGEKCVTAYLGDPKNQRSVTVYLPASCKPDTRHACEEITEEELLSVLEHK